MDFFRPILYRKLWESARADPEYKTGIQSPFLASVFCFCMCIVFSMVVIYEQVEQRNLFIFVAVAFFVIGLSLLYLSCSYLCPALKKVRQELRYCYTRVRRHHMTPSPPRRIRSQRTETGFVVQYAPGLETEEAVSGLHGAPSVHIPIDFDDSASLPGYEPPLEGAVGGIIEETVEGAVGGALTNVLVHREHEQYEH